MSDLPIVAAGREVPDAVDRIRRYCGLTWTGGPPETWAWHYYDVLPSQADVLDPVDVLAAAALHPGLGHFDLAYFREHRNTLEAWLSPLPVDLALADATVDVLDHLSSLPEALDGVTPTLLSKVLHRKRPQLIPLLDRHVIDWYRPVTAKRAAAEAWEPMVRAMHTEQLGNERRQVMAILLNGLERELWPNAALGERPRLSPLRAVDIAIWMGGR